MNASKLRSFMNMATGTDQNDADRDKPTACLDFCQRMCKAIASSGDVELVWLFFMRFFDNLKEKELLTSSLGSLIEKFGWKMVCTPLTNAIDRMDSLDAMSLALELAKVSDAQVALTTLAVTKAQLVPEGVLASSKHVASLWKCSASCHNEGLFNTVACILPKLDPSVLGPIITEVAEYEQAQPTPGQRVVLASLVSTRRRWLGAEISRLNEFTLQIPSAWISAQDRIETILREQKQNDSFVIGEFADISAALRFVENLPHSTDSTSRTPFTLEAHQADARAIVIVNKTGDQYEISRQQLEQYNAEINLLSASLSSGG